MQPKREVLATAHTPEELFEAQQQKAAELQLTPPSLNQRNDWGPIYANGDYDLRIDKQVASGDYVLCLLYKLKPTGGIWSKRRKG